MLDKIVEYINQNPIVFIAILTILLFITYSLYRKCGGIEYMTDITTPPQMDCCPCPKQDSLSATIEKKYVGNKKLYFTVTIDNKDYYLVSIPKSDCSNIDGKTADCTTNILALMEIDDVKNRMDDYAHKFDIEYKKCNFDQRLKCEDINKNNKDELAKCDKTYSICDKANQKYFVNMFTLDKAKVQDQFVLMSNPSAMDSINPDERISNSLIGTHNYKYVCTDKTLDSTDIFNNITFLASVIKKEWGIIGGISNTDKYKIRMGRQAYDSTTNKLSFDKNGDPVVTYMYFGVCNDAQTCSIKDKVIKRLCLYEDIMDKNVLEFSINTVN